MKLYKNNYTKHVLPMTTERRRTRIILTELCSLLDFEMLSVTGKYIPPSNTGVGLKKKETDVERTVIKKASYTFILSLADLFFF